MSYIKLLAQLIDFSITSFSGAAILQEVSSKYSNTFMKINEEIKYVIEINKYGVHYKEKGDIITIAPESIKSIEGILPDSGLYYTSEGYLYYVSKIPKRQWKRSLSLDFYDIFSVDQDRHFVDTEAVIPRLDFSNRMYIAVSRSDGIYFMTKKIGYIKEDNLVYCVSHLFKQEIKDWATNGKYR